MRVLVLGGYGMIGLAVAQTLLRAGHQVTGLGRSAAKGRAHLPDADWIEAEISRLTTPGDWAAHLAGIDVAVNASGALQDGARDRLQDTQSRATIALVRACEAAGTRRFIQISAPGADVASDTAFYRTKAEADSALSESALDWTILRPGVVIAPNAYGGTALLRMLAAFPVVQPLMMADAKIQTVAMDDVAVAVADCVNGAHIGVDTDLVEDGPHSLGQIVAHVRAWLGFAPARATVRLPRTLGYMVAKIADLAGWFGWRSPLRTTALRVLESDVAGDPGAWRARYTNEKPIHWDIEG